jgi:putative ABC transport system permease protein
MRWWDALRARVALLAQRGRAESRMDEEFRFHLEMETEANLRKGLPLDEARRRAFVSFGGVERHKEVMREGRGARALERAWRDARYAVRALARAPMFSVTAILTLALGSGSLTAIFALLNGILLSPLPYPDADRLVAVGHTAPGLGLARTGLSSGTYFHYQQRSSSLEGIALYTEAVVNLSGDDLAAERVELAMVSPEFFDVLQAVPILGRTFSPEEIAANDGLDMTTVLPVLLSHDLWQSRYGGDPGILGRTIDVNTRGRLVVGVLPASFAFPRRSTQIWMLSVTPVRTANFARGLDSDAVARLRPGVSSQEAEAELAQVLGSIEGEYPDATAQRIAEVRLHPFVIPLKDEVVGRIRGPLWILTGSMGLLLLAACANVTNLCLARSHVRQREMSVRGALGAGRMDLMRIFVGESLVLALAGAALGLVLAGAALSILLHFAPGELPRLEDVRVDGPVIGFALATALLVGAILSVGSMLRHGQTAPLAPALKSGGRGTVGPERQRVRGALVAAQVALALTLLAASALMTQSFIRLVRVNPGFEAEGVLAVDMGLPGSLSRSHRQIYESLLERVRALPGVTEAAAVTDLPLAERVWTRPFAYPLHVDGIPIERTPVDLRFFMPGYFQAMTIPTLQGVSFARGETAQVPNPVVISEALAARLFPGQNPIGKRIRRLEETGEEVTYGSEDRPQPDYVVAGVVADVRGVSLREGPAEIVYIPVLDPPVDPGFSPTEMSLVIRADVPPLMLAPAVRELVKEIHPVLGVARIRTLEGIVGASLARERLLTLLLAVAGGGSLLLGAVGIYGVVGYMARQRTQEIGVRMVLGARAREIVGLVLLDSIVMVGAGAVLGLVIAAVGTRALQSVLFGVSSGDPLTLLAITALVLAVALAAILGPATRAARVDPTTALKSE